MRSLPAAGMPISVGEFLQLGRVPIPIFELRERHGRGEARGLSARLAGRRLLALERPLSLNCGGLRHVQSLCPAEPRRKQALEATPTADDERHVEHKRENCEEHGAGRQEDVK